MSLPDVIPLFPLPNVVFFPGMPLPLHIFEPRYRAMIRDAAAGDRIVGMVLLRGDWQPRYEDKDAPIFAVGTAGTIVQLAELPDGRFNLVLRGEREFTIERELTEDSPYRRARVAWRAEPSAPLADALRTRLIGAVTSFFAASGQPVLPPPSAEVGDDVRFVSFVAQHLDVSPLEKQALLEAPSLAERAQRLCDTLAFRTQELQTPSGGASERRH